MKRWLHWGNPVSKSCFYEGRKYLLPWGLSAVGLYNSLCWQLYWWPPSLSGQEGLWLWFWDLQPGVGSETLGYKAQNKSHRTSGTKARVLEEGRTKKQGILWNLRERVKRKNRNQLCNWGQRSMSRWAWEPRVTWATAPGSSLWSAGGRQRSYYGLWEVQSWTE